MEKGRRKGEERGEQGPFFFNYILQLHAPFLPPKAMMPFLTKGPKKHKDKAKIIIDFTQKS
jgi:hypothetical protein